MGITLLVGTPINSNTPIPIGCVTFASPVEQHRYSVGLFSIETTPSNRSTADPPDSKTKELTIRKDPIDKSPKFRLQSPPPISSFTTTSQQR